MRTGDVIIVGGGIIGLSLAIALRKRGAQVLLVERGEPGREASHAAAGMLADSVLETPLALEPLARASAGMYPEFVHELQDESGIDVDLRDQGTLLFPAAETADQSPGVSRNQRLPAPLRELEPALADPSRPALFLRERSVDPRELSAAALKAAKHRGVEISSGSTVTKVLASNGRTQGVATDRADYHAPIVVNCAGAWAGQLPPLAYPTRPVKGQMLAVAERGLLRHVIRAPEVYLVPRSNGRILIGSTLEEAGYDKRVDANVIHRMHSAAVALCRPLADARLLEAWAGLRPGTPDGLPILGPTSMPGYFVAAGHFRDGILLAPATAQVMAQVVTGSNPDYDIAPFSPARFSIP
jgi:glycine oxidase